MNKIEMLCVHEILCYVLFNAIDGSFINTQLIISCNT